MKVSSLWPGSALGSTVLLVLFAACGGLNDGEIVVKDEKSSGGSGGSAAHQGGEGNDTGRGGDGSGDGGEPPVVISDDPPSVVAITPEDDESNVAPDAVIEIEFSETLDESTVNGDTIEIRDGDRVVEGELEFSGVTATFTPSSRLDLLASLTVTVKTGVTDLEGTALEEEFTSSFHVREGAWGHKITLNNEVGNLPEQVVPPPAVDARGNALAVWVQDTDETGSALQGVWVRPFTPGEGWGESLLLSGSAVACRQPAVAMSEDGDAIVAWFQEEDSSMRVYARRYVDGGWEPDARRIEAGNYDFDYQARLAAAISPGGVMHVVWNYKSSSYRFMATNRSQGFEAWDTSDTYLSSSVNNLSAPALALAQDDTGFLGWVSVLGGTATMRFLRYVPGVGWQDGSDDSGVGAPKGWSTHHVNVAADSKGGAMVIWNTVDEEIATRRFTKAAGWSDPVVANSNAGYLNPWAAKLAFTGTDVVAVWSENVDGIANIHANRYVGDAWGAEPVLVSDGDHSVDSSSDLGFGLDRHGNGIVTWTQANTVRFARLIGEAGSWLPPDIVDEPSMLNNGIIESRARVAPNGVAVTLYQESYPYAAPNRIFAAAFD